MRLTGLALLVPFVLITSGYGLLWGVLFLVVIGCAIIKGLDALYFAGQIRCPECDGSLWKCLKNGPRRCRLLLREEAVKCPCCGVDFSHRLENHGP